MKDTIQRSVKMFLSFHLIVLTLLLSALVANAQYPFYNPLYFSATPYCTPWSYMPFGYPSPILNAYTYSSYYPYALPLLNTLSLPLLPLGFSAPVIPSLPFGRIAMQATGALTGASAIAPVVPITSVAAPVVPITSVVAPVAPSTSVSPPISSTALSVLIASLLINTGNPQVTAVLTLILNDPTLLDKPLLLDALINTGNPEVAYVLALLSAGVI